MTSHSSQVTLDRSQREDIRAELELRANGCGGVEWGFACAQRECVHEQCRRLGRMIAGHDRQAPGFSQSIACHVG